ncbi:MAG: hypothetical protein EOO16_14500 [Chitinophagaceae bacterium]|nr:MAG: hypothetical protein EOO16_14500 [Chitinophagaceae bacterium]
MDAATNIPSVMWSLAAEFLKLAPALLLFPLSWFLAVKKLGVSADISYSTAMTMTTRYFFDSLTVTNHKDKTLTIFEVYAIYEKDLLIPILKCEPPLLIKAYESVNCKIDPISALKCYDMEFNFYPSKGSIEFYISTPSGIRKCKASSRPNSVTEMAKNDYRMVTIERDTFEGEVFSSSVMYAINFEWEGKKNYSFITSGGLLSASWPFKENAVPVEWLGSPEELESKIKTTVIHDRIGDFVITDLRDQSLSGKIKRFLASHEKKDSESESPGI